MKNFRNKPHRPKKNTLIVGRDNVIKAITEGKQLEKIYLQATAHGDLIDKIKLLASKSLIPISKSPIEKLNGFNVGEHEGCVALIAKIQYQNLQDIISFVVEKGETPLFLILDGITDIRNIGAIARSAFSFAAHAIIIPEKGVGTLNADAILTSAGALEQIPVCRVANLADAIESLHLNGIKVFASDISAEKKCFDINFVEPSAIIMGGEEKGIAQSLINICDEKFSIPMPGNFESLNVSVATGITLYEVAKQRIYSQTL